MNANRMFRVFLILLAVLLLLPAAGLAQEQQEGKNSGNYNVKQAIEFGGRITSFSGNDAVYRTFDNLQDGPRLLEHRLEMRSLDHQGWLFDDFFLSSFGYGGDPNAVTRLRSYKNRWYNFSATFRTARNQWDYNLLANPFNPPNSLVTTPTVPINTAFPADTSTPFSLHKFETVRRISDYSLTLAPQSAFRVRLGYARNVMDGPSFTTFHEGTDVLVYQPWKTTLDSYSFGVDFRGLPKTSISYDQFFIYYKGDTTWSDVPGVAPLGVPRFDAVLSNGSPVDLGIIFNAAISPATSRQPCQAPLTSQGPPAVANPACNGYQLYGRAGNVRTNYPTEQLSLQTNFFPRLDISARASYSSADADVLNYNEGYQGLVTRTRQRVFGIDGLTEAKRVSATADFAVTWTPPGQERLRFVDTFHFAHFRVPGLFDLTECSLFPLPPSTGSLILNPAQYSGQTTVPARCAAVLAATGTSTTVGNANHGSSSPADVINETFSTFLGQDMRQNQFEVLYDFHRRFQGRFGHRYTKRFIRESHLDAQDLLFFPNTPNRGACSGGTAVCTLQPDGVSLRFVSPFDGDEIDTEINEHVGLLGLTFRPVNELRIIYDMELASADHSFTRISPRQFQLYRIRLNYRPVQWFNLSYLANILERRNNVDRVLHKQHNRTYGFTATFEPNENFVVDLGYDFNDLSSQTNICFTLTPTPAGSTPCPTPTSAQALTNVSFYVQNTHYGYFDLMWRPWKRVKTSLGYNLVSTTGDTLLFTITTPPGPLRYNYHRPYAGVDLDLTGGFTFRTGWGYYGYNEKAVQDRFSTPRDFRGNVVNLSIRYSF